MILPIGAMLPWKRAKLGRTIRQLAPAMIVLDCPCSRWFGPCRPVKFGALGPIGMFLGAWLVSGSVVDTLRAALDEGAIARPPVAPHPSAARRLGQVPAAHVGLGVTFMGISGLEAWQHEDIRTTMIGEPFEVSGYTVTLEEVNREQGPNYISTKATMRIEQDGQTVALLHPEKRVYPVQAMPTTEAAISNGFWGDTYVVIGDPQDDGGWAVRTFIKPFVNWIWIGCTLMALGGLISLSDRRFRVAAGAARTRAPKGVPAE